MVYCHHGRGAVKEVKPRSTIISVGGRSVKVKPWSTSFSVEEGSVKEVKLRSPSKSVGVESMMVPRNEGSRVEQQIGCFFGARWKIG